MRKYRVVLAEDEKIVLKELFSFFEEMSDFDVVKHFSESEQAYDWIAANENSFDILVTDIEMEGANDGITLANKARKPTVFISGKLSNHVNEIVDINLSTDMPVEWLTKPATLEKLEKILAKITVKSNILSSALFRVKRNEQRGFKLKIQFDDILFIRPSSKGRNNKESFLSNGKKEILLDYTHEQLVNELPSNLIPIAKGLFISKKGIKSVQKNEIELSDDLKQISGLSVIGISKEYKQQFDTFF